MCDHRARAGAKHCRAARSPDGRLLSDRRDFLGVAPQSSVRVVLCAHRRRWLATGLHRERRRNAHTCVNDMITHEQLDSQKSRSDRQPGLRDITSGCKLSSIPTCVALVPVSGRPADAQRLL